MNTIALERITGDEPSFMDEVRVRAQERLSALEREAEQVRTVLALIERASERSAAPAPATPRNRNGHTSKRLQAVPRTASGRAVKGANKRRILALAQQRPGITASEIARETGIAPGVTATTVSRLKRNGVLEDHEDGGVRLAGAPLAGAPG